MNLSEGARCGSRVPVWLRCHDAPDSYRPGQLLTMLPVSGVLLERDATYAAVVLRSAFARPRTSASTRCCAARSPAATRPVTRRGEARQLVRRTP
ncbi:MAG: hypothetical protein IPK07_35570 [Deltaproteobacteria bacterium]|nr:hypothetical protein [Deltaproteobacteria bacterium]